MLEIFIPTEISGILTLHTIDPGFFGLLENHFPIRVTPFESQFFRGFHIITTQENQDIVILCNGTFGTGYFIDYDWQNSEITTLGRRFFEPDSIGQELISISSNFESIVQTLSSSSLLTKSKKEESISKIKHSFFLLSGVVFNLSQLLRKVRENIQELETIAHDPDQKTEYQAHGALLIEPLRTKEIELNASMISLEGKVDLFIDATKHFITI